MASDSRPKSRAATTGRAVRLGIESAPAAIGIGWCRRRNRTVSATESAGTAHGGATHHTILELSMPAGVDRLAIHRRRSVILGHHGVAPASTRIARGTSLG